MAASATHFLSRLAAVARVTEWWGYKFAPIMATCFATALLLNAPLSPLAGRLLLLLLALTVAATYVSLLNDWTDRADDLAAGKTNRLAQTSGGRFAALLGTCLVLGIGFGGYFWHAAPVAAGLYLGTWVAYTLYSVPPFRFKGRGLVGVLADAVGAHLCPQLLGVVLVSRWSNTPVPALWLAVVGVWSLTSGLRNIIWHQLGDAANDAQAGIRTFVTGFGAARARRTAEWVVFPVELLALLLLLWLGGRAAPVIALGLYGGLLLVRALHWGMTLVIAQPGPQPHIVLNEYYEAFYPVALLLSAWQLRAADGWLLLGFAGLFGYSLRPTLQTLGNALGQLAGVCQVEIRAYLRKP